MDKAFMLAFFRYLDTATTAELEVKAQALAEFIARHPNGGVALDDAKMMQRHVLDTLLATLAKPGAPRPRNR